MKREAGWGAGALIAIAALFGINSQQAGKLPGDVTPTTGNVQNSQGPALDVAVTGFDRGPCVDIEERIQSFLSIQEKDQIAAPASCYPPGKDKKPAKALQDKAGSLRFIIATLPDPLYTHFSLSFDRNAEAIQQAAQDQGYLYDSSWLPWETDERSFPRIEDQDKADIRKQEREDQPGILLFRHSSPANAETQIKDCKINEILPPYACGLVVFIVGEEPTSGIHRRQFQNAAAWIAALHPADDDNSVGNSRSVGILGPTFSGSLPSLAQLLAENSRDLAKASLNVYSGSVTSNDEVRWFAQTADVANFRSFQESDHTVLGEFCTYLRDQEFPLNRVAVISEDETAFGSLYKENKTNEPSKPDDDDIAACNQDEVRDNGPAYLYYPRDISALRDAYQKQSIFNLTGQAADSARHTLPSDLADPQRKEHDTIRNYSGDQTALSQEAVLLQIVSMLRVHRSAYLVLRSSNPLDQLFLSHFFRLTYPEGRVVIQGADLLLRRESGAAGLSGIMTLTTYPLLPWEPDWTRIGKEPFHHHHRAFAQDGAEGTYIAARLLVNLAGEKKSIERSEYFLPPNSVGLRISDYALPFWADTLSNQPQVWLSVLGRDGFWPVATLPPVPEKKDYLNDPSLGLLGRFSHLLPSLANTVKWTFHPNADKPEGQDIWPPMPLSMKVCLFLFVLWALFHGYCCWFPSITAKPGYRAHFVRIAGHSHPAMILFGSVVVALIPILLAWAYGAMYVNPKPLPHLWWYRVFLPVTWFIAGLAVCANTWVESEFQKNGDNATIQEGARAVPRGNAIIAWQHNAPAMAAGDHVTEQGNELRPSVKSWLARRSKELMGLAADLIAKFREIFKVIWMPFLLYTLATVLLYCIVYLVLDDTLLATNRIPTYWRAINLTNGVSPLVPLLALTAGLYLWFWCSLQGLALFSQSRPLLPCSRGLEFEQQDDHSKHQLLQMFSREAMAKHIEDLCGPFATEICLTALILFATLFTVVCLLSSGLPVRSLGSRNFSWFFFIWMDLCISLTLANAWQLWRIWSKLHQLLLFMDRMPLRRTLEALKGLSWGSIWKMGGSVLDMRYHLVFRQLESLTHLRTSVQEFGPQPYTRQAADDKARWLQQIKETKEARVAFGDWYALFWNDWKARDLTRLEAFQESVSKTTGLLLTEILLPEWRKERESLVLDLTREEGGDNGGREKFIEHPVSRLQPHIRNAEEFVCLVYLGFVQNVLGRMRSLAMGILWLFVAVTLSTAIYPFDPRPELSVAMIVLFLVLGTVIVIVYSQMHRDATLSHVTNTEPGKLGQEFWFKLIGFGVGPALGLLATIFPEITGSLLSWLQPGLASIK